MLGLRNTGWIGIDIGSHAVKLAQVRRRGTTVELLDAKVIRRTQPWDEAALRGPLPRSSADELLAGITVERGFRGRSTSCALPMPICEHRVLDLRGEAGAAKPQALTRCLEQAGVRVSDFQCAAWPASRAAHPAGALAQQVHALLLPSAWGGQVVADHQQAGLRCEVLDGLPQALARAVSLTNESARGEPTAAIDWGSSSMTFCLINQGVPAFVRSIPGGGLGKIVERVESVLELTSDEAQTLVREAALPHANLGQRTDRLQATLGEILASDLNQIVEGLHETLSYVQRYLRDIYPTAIRLFGGGAALNHVEPFLTAHLGLPAKAWRLPRRAGGDASADAFPAAEFLETQRSGPPSSRSPARVPDAVLGTAIALSALAWANP